MWLVVELALGPLRFTPRKECLQPSNRGAPGPVLYGTSQPHPAGGGAPDVLDGLVATLRVIMEFEVSKRHILRPTLSTDMVKWDLYWERQKRCYGRKRQGLMAHKYCYNQLLNGFCWGGVDEDKRLQKNDPFWILQNYYFGYILKKQHIHCLVHGHSSWSTSVYT